MKFSPHVYQRYAIERIMNVDRLALFLDMGLGKTSITLTAIEELIHDRFEVNRVLIIAPKRVAEDTWSREVEKWEHLRHLRVSKVLGSEKQRISGLLVSADIYTINRENVDWLCDWYGSDWDFDMVVIDELSSFKSPSSRRFKALRKVMPFVKRVVGLTGTPAPNGLLDLWSQIYLLDQGERLGRTVTEYRNRYFFPGQSNGHVVFSYVLKPGAEEKIYERIGDICVSMKAKDWLDLPERIDNEISVILPSTVSKQFREFKKERMLTEEITAANAAVLTNKLLQFSNGAIYDDNGNVEELHDCKLNVLGDLIEAANGNPLLVFYSYRHDKQRIMERYNARHLDTSSDIAEWNAGKIPVLLAHPASAGHGINLQDGGSTVVWFSLPFSLELYEQANARLHRQGQRKQVIIHHLICENTFDRAVYELLGKKEDRQEKLLAALKGEIERVT
jgi:SNF2 family DNA or RNA helicase